MTEPEIIDIVPSANKAESNTDNAAQAPQNDSPTPPLCKEQSDVPSQTASQTVSQSNEHLSKVATQSFQLHLRNQLLNAIEELRLRRVTDVENEDKTKQLVNDKHVLKNAIDELKQKIKCLENEQNDKMRGLKAKFESICKESKAEKNKVLVNLETKEKELKSLKDEVRAMQLAKYSLEKKLEELERKQHVHSSINENKLIQTEKLEETAENLTKKFAQLVEHHDRLAKNVKVSARLHDKLLYVNTHKDCEIQVLKAEVNTLKKDVSDCRVKLHSQSAADKQQLQDEISKNSSLTKQIKRIENELQQTKTQTQDYLQDKERNLQALKESHELLDKQVILCNKNNTKASDLEQKLKDLTAQFDELKRNYDDKAMELEIEKAVSTKDAEEWKEKDETLQHKMDALEGKNTAMSKSLSELDALNSTWSRKNAELAEKTKELQEFIDRPRVDADMQCEYLMETEYVQTELLSETCSTQTECAEVSVATQSEQHTDVKKCQTEQTRCVSLKVQTDDVQQNHFQVQVDLEPQVAVVAKKDVPAVARRPATVTSHLADVPLSNSQPLPCHHIEVNSDVLSSQPLSTPSPNDESECSPSKKDVHEGSGDYLNLSPYSRFQQTLKQVGTVTKRKSLENELEVTAKKTKPIGDAESSHRPGQRLSFKITDESSTDQDDAIPQTQIADQAVGPVGILQNQAIKKRGSAKKVTFSSQLEEKKEFVVTKSVKPMDLSDDDEISLFSDDEEKFEISTQISAVETILMKDRLN